MKKVKGRAFGIICAGLVFLICVAPPLWQVNYYWGFPLTEQASRLHEARGVYENSRKSNISSNDEEFASFGIKCGMTAAEIEELLPKWSLKVEQATETRPPWNGFVNFYKFTYGPKDISRGIENQRPFFSETLTIYFNPEGNAQKLYVDRWGEGFVFTDTWTEIELCTGENADD